MKESKFKVRLVLDCPIEIDGILYKATVIPFTCCGVLVDKDCPYAKGYVLGLEKTEGKKPFSVGSPCDS